jgi:hypothetical protein
MTHHNTVKNAIITEDYDIFSTEENIRTTEECTENGRSQNP